MVRLTEAGLAFLEPCRAALQAMDVAGLQARNSGSGEHGVIRVGFNAGFGADQLVALVRAVRERHPHLELRMGSSLRNSEILRLVEDDQLDVGFVGGPVSGKGLGHFKVSMARLCVMLLDEHPLAQLPEVPIETLRDESLVLIAPAPGPTLRSMVDEAFEIGGFRPARVTEVKDGMTVMTLVRAGIGVGFGTSVSTGLTPAGLRLLPVAENIDTVISLVWQAGNESKALANVLRSARALFPGVSRADQQTGNAAPPRPG
jgi:DNA-binding transcriptional LysR family regulator